ncbi:MAG: hypothetical protein AAFS01_06500 [Pseudomonadota bacterium]
MWAVYKTKPGDTMDTIIAQHKIKDPVNVLLHKNNAKIKKDLKAGKELPKGTQVTIPDPKGKVYKVPTPKGVIYMDEKTYKDYLKGVHQRMEDVIFGLRQRVTYATGRHDAQLKIAKDQWFVAACLDMVNSVPEPKSRKKAETSFKNAEKAYSSRNYKGFEKAVNRANIDIATYKNEVLAWIDGIINAGEGTVKVLTGVKDVGMVCAGVAAMTVAAPVTLGAAVITGAAVGGGVSLAYNGADALGRESAGVKHKSANQVLTEAAGGALGGALGAGIGKLFMKFAAPSLINACSKSSFLSKQASRLLLKGPIDFNSLYAAEMKVVIEKLGINSAKALVAARPAIMQKVVLAFLTKFSIGSINKYFNTGGEIIDFVLEWLKKDPKRANGKDPSKAAKAMTNDFLKSPQVDKMFDDIVTSNKKKLVQLMREEIKAVAIVEMKKERA